MAPCAFRVPGRRAEGGFSRSLARAAKTAVRQDLWTVVRLWMTPASAFLTGRQGIGALRRQITAKSHDERLELGGRDAAAGADVDRRELAGLHELVDLGPSDAECVGGFVGVSSSLSMSSSVIARASGRACLNCPSPLVSATGGGL